MLVLALNFGEILREFLETLGKCPMCDRRSVGLKGLKRLNILHQVISFFLMSFTFFYYRMPLLHQIEVYESAFY